VHALRAPLDGRDLLAAAGGVVLAALGGLAIAAPGAALGPGSVLAGLAAAVAVVVALASPRAGLALAVLSLGLPLHAGIAGVEVRLGHLLLGAYVLRVAIDVGFGEAKVPRSMALPVGLVLFGALLASIAGPRPGSSLFSLFDVFFLPLAAGLAIAAAVDPRRDLRLLVLLLAGSLVLASGAAIVQAAGFVAGPLEPVQDGRANGLYEQTNVLSGFVAPLVALLTGITACAWREIRLAPLVLLGPILLGVAAVFLTLSRGALLGLGVGIVVMIAFLFARRQVTALLAVALVVLAALFVALPQVPQSERSALTERFQRLFQPGTERGRELVYTQAVEAIRENPVTGLGPLTFGRLTRERTTIGDIEPGREHAHNLLFESYLSFGPLGVLGLLWLIGSSALRYARATRPGPAGDQLVVGWAVGALAALAVLVVQGIGDFVFSNLEPLGLLLLVLAVAHTRGFVPPVALRR
jgi:O-antigen ligase